MFVKSALIKMDTDQANYTNQQRLIATLLEKYRSHDGNLIETHISWILLVDQYAYKIKKAINLGFLNFSHLETRRFYCLEEVRLNQRLAPHIYIDVISIGGSLNSPQFDTSPVQEYAVRMHRFEIKNQLDHLLLYGEISPHHMDNLAATLSAFHNNLIPADIYSSFGTPATIHSEIMQNFDQLQSLLTSQSDLDALTELKQATLKAYNSCEAYFSDRRAKGFVRECHGDLHLGNIVLIDNQPIPFDCIEFNPAFRWIDVIDEVAFLVMDLLHCNHPELAFRFLNSYLEITGDYAGVSVLHFYLAYRAGVRAKISAIRAVQSSKDELANCRNYLALASQCLTHHRPALIITQGLPGSGKSTFARAAMERLQAIRIRSDVERKRLFGISPLSSSDKQREDIYSINATERTYAHLLDLARNLLNSGARVIVDAAFLKQNEREEFHQLALSASAPFIIVSIKASTSILNTRIESRQIKANDASEAGLDVLQKLTNNQEPLMPHELTRTVEFINEGSYDDNFVNAAIWKQLDKLLAE